MTTDIEFAATAPVFRVGGSVCRSLSRDVTYLSVSESVGGLRNLVATFTAFGLGPSGNEELLYSDRELLDFGKPVEVSLGVPGNDRVVFSGEISELSISYGNGTPPTAQIGAEDALMRLRMTRRRRTYEQMTDAEIVAAVGREHGLRTSTELDGPTYDVVHQANQTDLAFIRERAAMVNGEVWFHDGTLHASSRRERLGANVTLRQELDLIELTARADLAHQRSSVSVSGYDADDRAMIDERVDDAVVRAEVTAGLTGATVLGQAFGDLPTTFASGVPLNAEEAHAWAAGEMLSRARQFVTLSGTTRGTPSMLVGSQIRLVGVSPLFDGPGYVVVSYTHTYDIANGLRTSFEAECPTIAMER